MADLHPNFAYSLVATAPSPATSGTSLVVTAGQGALFADFPFNAVIWPTNAQPLSTTAEIVRVTGRSTDTLTITRAQEGTAARTVVVGDQIAVVATKKVFTDAEQFLQYDVSQTAHGFSVGNVVYNDGSGYSLAKADSAATAEVAGIVAKVVSANIFTIHLGGRISDLSALTEGTVYFLSGSVAGALTATEPSTSGHVSKPLLIADSTTSGFFVNMRGNVIGISPSLDYWSPIFLTMGT